MFSTLIDMAPNASGIRLRNFFDWYVKYQFIVFLKGALT